MQAHGAARGAAGVGTTTMPRRGGLLEVLVAIAAIVVIAAVVALAVWAGPSGTSEAETASPSANFSGPAVIHDDAGNLPMGAERAAFYQMRQGAVKNIGIMHASMVKD